MKISAKIDYACRALLELSLHWPNKEPLAVYAIAQKQNIPIKFLVQILLNLKQFGFVESVRGKKGGYILRKPPAQITLKDVVRHFSENNNFNHPRPSRVLDPIWEDAQEVYFNFLEEKDFQELIQRQKSLTKVEMYAI